MSEVVSVTAAGLTHEPLPSAMARHRHAFGDGGMTCLILMPDGSAFSCRANGEALDAEHLTYDETVAKLIEIYGLDAFKGS
ncbi:hypothetical protein [Sinorhizobium meliloti]|uniref:hypothetical protein n=1 Tax=Rhizobium meliloti TaxID=382 RepID=UPI000B4A2D1B|nr:hypothetical protein [Sinorhizobium meliloti]ASQ11084.1 hypothetical protein CDO22_13535 [Sinorhizobium meliloti]MQU85743.1 hypothetical protein [Sinorhizobium meliloti]MQU89279.1 hypothetical protein [Sinorhizobium meliloti]